MNCRFLILSTLVYLSLTCVEKPMAMPLPEGDTSGGYIEQPASDGVSRRRGRSIPGQSTDEESDLDGALQVPRKPISTMKYYSPRVWSAGVRVGSYGNTGLYGQYVGDGEVAWNVGINVMDTLGNIGMGFTIERLMLFDDDFAELTWKNLQRWHDSRGRLVYYTGFGLNMDALGFYPRIPFGVQFTMTGDPVTWFAQAAVAYGPALGFDSTGSLLVSPEIGVRYVIEQ